MASDKGIYLMNLSMIDGVHKEFEKVMKFHGEEVMDSSVKIAR
ncbi:MAG TPA: hypothetical protein VE544_04345 [Nitrososphaeraceae archaeon]|jgi:hypothetical protein|nr:hypothetical protein [Nitrososphaeraceae archaeon]